MMPALLITTDEASGTALVRGPDAEIASRMCCPERKYSRYSKGWIVPLSDLDDLLAYGQHFRLLYVVHPLRRGAA